MNIHRCKSKIHTDLSCHCLVVSHVSADSFEPKLQCFGLISSIETKFSQTLKSTFDIEIVQRKFKVQICDYRHSLHEDLTRIARIIHIIYSLFINTDLFHNATK